LWEIEKGHRHAWESFNVEEHANEIVAQAKEERERERES
jgi:hypothetical protein